MQENRENPPFESFFLKKSTMHLLPKNENAFVIVFEAVVSIDILN